MNPSWQRWFPTKANSGARLAEHGKNREEDRPECDGGEHGSREPNSNRNEVRSCVQPHAEQKPDKEERPVAHPVQPTAKRIHLNTKERIRDITDI
ncbi:MAG: hypothetical protein JWL80_465 [Parcubacteria group bacterium]|nr:hypothetical protein [Parcubacteria group bacterium]